MEFKTRYELSMLKSALNAAEYCAYEEYLKALGHQKKLEMTGASAISKRVQFLTINGKKKEWQWYKKMHEKAWNEWRDNIIKKRR